MNLLLTADASGGVGAHARTLAQALAARGHRITLVVFGAAKVGRGPAGEPDGRNTRGGGVRVERCPLALEWESEKPLEALRGAVARGRRFLQTLAERDGSELLHACQFAWAGCIPELPTLLAVHSDVVSWWRAVHGSAPPGSPYHRWYRGLARTALERAEVVVSPSRSSRRDLAASFGFHGGVVIRNGSELAAAPPAEGCRSGALSAGRWWDEGKQLHLLTSIQWPMPGLLAGDTGGMPTPARANLRYAGRLTRRQLQAAMQHALLYVGTSAYEPFGLAPLEAALAGCALLLNDIPSFRETWGPAAFYFCRNQACDLERWLQRLAADSALLRHGAGAACRRARRYRVAAMTEHYETLYRRLALTAHRGSPPKSPAADQVPCPTP